MRVWDLRMLDLADHVAQWSKDPSTKVGCVIARPDHTIASVGYNGFPRGVSDREDRLEHRPTKYAMTVHAEANAVANAHGPVDGYTAYCTFLPCSPCAGLMIQAGIKRIVTHHPSDAEVERWGDSFVIARTMLLEAVVEVNYYE